MESLLESYMTTVTTSDVDDMCRSILRWLDQNCSLVTLRRGNNLFNHQNWLFKLINFFFPFSEVLNSLRHLSTSTNILTSPSTLREEILESIANSSKKININNNRMTKWSVQSMIIRRRDIKNTICGQQSINFFGSNLNCYTKE